MSRKSKVQGHLNVNIMWGGQGHPKVDNNQG